MSSLYELQAPTEWAAPPEVWSSSSLDEVGACPRRWQLLRSRWGDYQRFPVRPHPAAIEGQIVHDALDRLARACGERGNPAFGTPAFTEAAAEAGARDPGGVEPVLGHHPAHRGREGFDDLRLGHHTQMPQAP